MRGGAYDQREGPRVFGARAPFRLLSELEDVLSFATPPLEREIEVTGPAKVRLWIASDCPDTGFTAKLIDLHPPNEDYPEGFAMNLTEGLLRVRYRDSWERPALMAPGEVYAITIELFPSGNFPHFDVNPNSGEPEGSMDHRRVAENRVFVDVRRPSHIVLPIIP